MLNLVDDFQHNKPLVLNPKFVDGFKKMLSDSSLDKVCLGQVYLEIILFICLLSISLFCLGED